MTSVGGIEDRDSQNGSAHHRTIHPSSAISLQGYQRRSNEGAKHEIVPSVVIPLPLAIEQMTVPFHHRTSTCRNYASYAHVGVISSAGRWMCETFFE